MRWRKTMEGDPRMRSFETKTEDIIRSLERMTDDMKRLVGVLGNLSRSRAVERFYCPYPGCEVYFTDAEALVDIHIRECHGVGVKFRTWHPNGRQILGECRYCGETMALEEIRQSDSPDARKRGRWYHRTFTTDDEGNEYSVPCWFGPLPL